MPSALSSAEPGKKKTRGTLASERMTTLVVADTVTKTIITHRQVARRWRLLLGMA
jgi:hypothetical protein